MKKLTFMLFMAGAFVVLANPAAVAKARPVSEILPTRLTCEYMINPLIDTQTPRLSWINQAGRDAFGQKQSAYQIQVASSREKLLRGDADLWDSRTVKGDQSVLVKYQGRPLQSGEQCWWRVRVWDGAGSASEWSVPAQWNMGLLNPSDWKAQWIGAPWQEDRPLAKDGSETPPPAPMLRKSFDVSKEIESARVYVTGLGYFELYLNGEKVSDDVLVPNQTNYGKRPDLVKYGIPVEDNFKEYRVMYLSYDVKDRLQKGENVMGAILGNGFYNAVIHWVLAYGSPCFISQLHITYKDGTQDVIVSDQTWTTAKSAITDQVYAGEHYDARCEQPDWCTAGFDDSQWQPAALRKAPEGKLQAQTAHADKVMEHLKPVKVEKLGDGHYKVDFGQEISGWVRLNNMQGEAGRRIDIKYLSESPNGSNSYTMKGSGLEFYAPRFTWFVFRDVEITNWPGELDPAQITAEAVYTDVETTGRFECSNPLFNQINKIWWRSQTDNMHGGVASDCPHRERSAYTGDGQVACVTVMHNFDAAAFYTKWIQDILGAQNPETGYVPNGAPWQPGCGGGVAWGAAMNIMPWEFYQHYGDRDMLVRNYEGMKAQMDYMCNWIEEDGTMQSKAPLGKEPVYWMNLGDWCPAFDFPADNLVHTFYFWRCADLTAKTATVLGNKADAEKYTAMAEKSRQAFHRKFYDPVKGTYGPCGGNIFALRMGVPAEYRDKVIAALKEDIAKRGGNLDTGIFGTQFFFEVLADNGLNDLAYAAMNKRDYPSFGHWIEQGATTTWEQWNGENSRNHPMFGGSLVWFYRKVAGMNTDESRPGYRHIVFRPQPVADLTYAKYSTRTPYGDAGINWNLKDGTFTMDVTVPVGATATVYLPLKNGQEASSLNKPGNKFVKYRYTENGYAVYEVSGSGKYKFSN